VRKRDQIGVNRKQQQFNGHQQYNDILPVQEDTRHTDGKKNGSKNQVIR
jgi:hypothetical protein